MRKNRRQGTGPLIFFLVMLVFAVLVLSSGITFGIFYLLMRRGIIFVNPERPSITLILLAFVLASILIGIILSLIMTYIPLRALRTIINGLHRLADGDFSCRIKLGFPYVTRDIEESFNTLAEELGNTEMLRSDFVNNFSHEIKTPVVSIRGFARQLQKQNLTPQQKEYIDIIAQESDRLSHITEKVLELTRVENQTILSDVSEYDLSEQLRQCCLMFIDRAENKNLEMDIDISEVQIHANQQLMQEVWINIIDNAVKFSPDGGTVKIRLAASSSAVTVTISNTSDPIPEDVRSRLFQKFYQGDPSRTKEGTGIGLSIVKRIIELHGGTAVTLWEEGTFAVRISLPC